MKNIIFLGKELKESIIFFEIIISFVVLFILLYSISNTIYNTYIKKNNYKKITSKINLINSISLSLSFILCTEILKFFYIKLKVIF